MKPRAARVTGERLERLPAPVPVPQCEYQASELNGSGARRGDVSLFGMQSTAVAQKRPDDRANTTPPGP